MKLTFKVYMNGSKWKSLRLNSNSLTLRQVYKQIKGNDFEFIDNSIHHNNLTDKFIVAMIEDREKDKAIYFQDTKLLTRIIKNNGFINYIKELESK